VSAATAAVAAAASAAASPASPEEEQEYDSAIGDYFVDDDLSSSNGGGLTPLARLQEGDYTYLLNSKIGRRSGNSPVNKRTHTDG
jgi:hypothetical protein